MPAQQPTAQDNQQPQAQQGANSAWMQAFLQAVGNPSSPTPDVQNPSALGPAVLQNLLQSTQANGNAQPGMVQPQPTQPQMQQATLAPSQQILQKAATKQLQSIADNHAQNTDSFTLSKWLDNINTPNQGMGQNMGGQQPAPLNPSSLAPQQTAQQAPTQQSTPTTTPSGVSNPGDAFQEQAMKIAQQKPGLLMSIFRGTFENDKKLQLDNQKEAQEIAQGGTPLSPQDKVAAIGNWNSALLKQHQDFQSDLSEQMKSTTDALDAFVKNTPLPTKVADWTAYNQKIQQYQENASNIATKMTQGFNKFKNLQLTNPMTGKKGATSHAVGDTVTYNGKQHIIKSINDKTGMATIE